MENNIDKYLGLIIQHFSLEEETIDSLKKKFEIKHLTKNRIRFDITLETSYSKITKIINDYSQYGEYKPTKDISSIVGSKFIVYPTTESEQIHKFVKQRFSRYNYWEFEQIDNEYSIAYD